VDGVSLPELYKFVALLPEIRGIGFYPSEKVLHIDTRPLNNEGTRDEWIKDNGKISPLTAESKVKYNLS
jgi:hypothetical protein